MPGGVDFHLPFPGPRTEPAEIGRTRLRGAERACGQGLLRSTEKAVGYFRGTRPAG